MGKKFKSISYLLESDLDTEEDKFVQFRETFNKEKELKLCLAGQERPLIDGKRRDVDNVPFEKIDEHFGFKHPFDFIITIGSVLEKEWGYAKIEWEKQK
tara:strand:+ start:348 stop:644 length:297 start_codon:yes stop_codon:yes gene_type:complete